MKREKKFISSIGLAVASTCLLSFGAISLIPQKNTIQTTTPEAYVSFTNSTPEFFKTSNNIVISPEENAYAFVNSADGEYANLSFDLIEEEYFDKTAGIYDYMGTYFDGTYHLVFDSITISVAWTVWAFTVKITDSLLP